MTFSNGPGRAGANLVRAGTLSPSLSTHSLKETVEQKLPPSPELSGQGLLGLFRLHIESTPLAYLLLDAELRIIEWNPAAAKLFGYPRDAVRGRDAMDLIVPESSREQVWKVMERVRRGEKSAVAVNENQTKDGRSITCEWHNTPLFDEEGNFNGFLCLALDLTSRREAERKRLRLGQYLQSLLQATDQGICGVDAQGQCTFINQAGAAMLGYSQEELLGQDMHALVHHHRSDGSLFAREDCPITRAYRGGKGVHVVGEVFWRKDGTSFPVEYSSHPLTSDCDAGAVITFYDVTERQRIEEALRSSNNLLQAVTEGTTDAVFVKDARGIYLMINSAGARFLGREPQEVIGRHDSELFSPDTVDQVFVSDRSIIESGQVRTYEEVLTAAGVTRVYQATKGPYRDAQGHVIGIIGISRDITDQKRAAEALRLRDRAMQAVTQGIVLTDGLAPDNPILYASPGYEAMTGYKQEELLGKNPRLLQGPETDPRALARLREAVREQRAERVELINYRKDGTSFWNEVAIAPVRDDTGRLTHWVGVKTDISERRRTEEALRQSQKMEAVGQLAGGVAHDFNNLLTVITGYSDLLLQEMASGDPRRELLQEIRQAGERSASLTRQLLTFSRKQVLAPKVLDLNDVVRDMSKMLRRVIGEDVKLETNLHPNPLRVLADLGQMEQVLLNLSVNARDAMPSGGVLRIATRAVEREREGREFSEIGSRPSVLLEVSDTGRGMTEHVRHHIFEPFFTTKEVGKGTGLGLAVVHGAVTQNHGTIEVASEPGHGTSFRIFLPLQEENSMCVGEMPASPLAAAQGQETLLLVEDDPGVRALAIQVLTQCGFRVLEAGNGEEGLRVFAAHPEKIHLVITDVVMPGLGGLPMIEALTGLHPDLKVLFISGYTEDMAKLQGLQHEGKHFLRKPFSPRALVGKVRELLDGERNPGSEGNIS